MEPRGVSHVISSALTVLLLGAAAGPAVGNAKVSEHPATDALLRSIPDWLVRQPEPPAPEPPEAASVTTGFLDTLRAHFVLDHAIERRRVRAEINWVRRHPQFLDRVAPRVERHLPGICAEVLARGMPGEICLLPIIESALNPFARSRSGAVGYWQFIRGTAERYDLKMDWWVDERRDPVASTDAALRYLADLHELFDDWLLAFAAYNCGERAVARALKAAPAGASFFDLRLPRETRAYVPRLLAFAAIFSDPDAHGIALPGRLGRNEALAKTYVPVALAGQVDLSRAAQATGLTVEELYRLNPALNQWATHPDGPHRLLVPAGRSDALARALADVPREDGVGWVHHRIAENETLGHIALRYRTDVAALMATNDLPSTLIRAGDSLLVPRPGGSGGRPPARGRPRPGSTYVVQAGDSLWEISRRTGVPLQRLLRDNDMQLEQTLSIGRRLNLASGSQRQRASTGTVRYRVRPGDSLDRIARQFRVSVQDIVAWNALDPRAYIFPDQELVLRPDASG